LLLLLKLMLIEDLLCLINFIYQLTEVVKVRLNLIKSKIDEHTCNLRSTLFSNKPLYELVDKLTYEIFQVRVIWNNYWEKPVPSHVVGIDDRVNIRQVTLLKLLTTNVNHPSNVSILDLLLNHLHRRRTGHGNLLLR
jgi:hypothetical protein